ncbi:hypothetical protein DTO013E5_8450 [Penicillium roqueforti]|uniref:Genomic scaffold, ProqFM164S01 n=1 Tax=Penicillium roqueforti (strain FM164) TaxID=1365484 RepID=W6QDV6_PENRF|nr:uncharacterized protein LCP9604111_8576 [Penicillium roqueforti]CDM27742.1 unnamed protein product [Penicillium roqueforti FM164]KAF9241036.1 hypothetical protein LCP9604111_8576 [Penicillium roqueforti]KAI2681056.1 hypothetical protein LCP963914a_7007 [Penicillium roqueforti]KAI2689616.1 hypothetical protein CBS147355_67 [Penicillium roqueforti]KAI2698278.1 hypothetical protein CBS147372_7296 [Penicillium roqueforti]
MNLISLSGWLALWAGIFSAALAALALEKEVSFNETSATLLSSRSIEKREVFFGCSNSDFSGTLAQAIQDASAIISNMVAHLELAISLYNEDGSGNLKASKATRAQRTFDEHNAFASYVMFITKHYFGPDDPRNKNGLEKLKGTRDMARTIQSQYANYLAGRPVRWIRGGFPYINIYCNDADVYSERDSAGLTYTEATGKTNPSLAKGGTYVYWIFQTKGTPNKEGIWVPYQAICALQDGADQTRFGPVPALPGIKAYVYGAIYGLVQETMVFCSLKFDKWTEVETSRIGSGLHYRDLHVEIGSSPTTNQKSAIEKLLAQPDFIGKEGRGIKWLSDFLVSTVIHESTHAEAFVGGGSKTLIDVKCTSPAQNSLNLACMSRIAKGTDGLDKNGNTQGHKDAEAFAIYAMTMWVNTVYWYAGYSPKDRNTYKG